MRLSKKQKKYVHAALTGFITGVLTAAQLAFAVPGGFTEKKAIIAALVGMVTGGLARMAGALLDSMNTTDSPNVP